jgi:hypothetical protein
MNYRQARPVVLLFTALAACMSLPGCATKSLPVPAAHTSPEILAPVLDGSVLLAGRIVADGRPIDLSGEFTAHGRAAFEEARSARIAGRNYIRSNTRNVGGEVLKCVISVVGIVACPVGFALVSGMQGTLNGIRYINASAREPSLLIPEKRAYGLAAMFEEQGTGAALVARASRFTMVQGGDDARRIVVRMKAVQTSRLGPTWLRLRITAEAQAFASNGVASAATEHVYAWTYASVSAWTEHDDERVRQAFNEALDALAASIVSTYMMPWES